MSWRIHSCVTVTVTLLVLVSDVNSSIPVVIKLNKDVPMGQFNCQDTVSHIKVGSITETGPAIELLTNHRLVKVLCNMKALSI